MKNYLATLFILLFGAAIAGCNTTRGIGQDVEAAGEKIEEVAENAQDKLNDDDK